MVSALLLFCPDASMQLNHTARVRVAIVPKGDFGNLFRDMAGSAAVVSDRLVRHDLFTSAVVYQFELPFRSRNTCADKLTRDVPAIPSRSLENLDSRGIARIGSLVQPGDVLVGKSRQSSSSEFAPSVNELLARIGLSDRDDSLYYDILDPGLVCAVHVFGLWRYDCGSCGPVALPGALLPALIAADRWAGFKEIGFRTGRLSGSRLTS